MMIETQIHIMALTKMIVMESWRFVLSAFVQLLKSIQKQKRFNIWALGSCTVTTHKSHIHGHIENRTTDVAHESSFFASKIQRIYPSTHTRRATKYIRSAVYIPSLPSVLMSFHQKTWWIFDDFLQPNTHFIACCVTATHQNKKKRPHKNENDDAPVTIQ